MLPEEGLLGDQTAAGEQDRGDDEVVEGVSPPVQLPRTGDDLLERLWVEGEADFGCKGAEHCGRPLAVAGDFVQALQLEADDGRAEKPPALDGSAGRLREKVGCT